MISKYFNPYTDFGFKKLFGEEASKDLLIDFLNQLLPEQHQIAELTFKNPENLSSTLEERKAIFDVYCESKTGERFIVEMQKAKVNFFKGASLEDPKGLFNAGLGAKAIRSIDLHQGDPLQEADLQDLVRAAIAFNLSGGKRSMV